jgi:hypothetical protein
MEENTNIEEKIEEIKRTTPTEFASLGEMIALTVSKRTSKYSKDDINSYLNDTVRYAQNLRQASDYFYNSNGIYKSIINAFTNLATLDNIILPSLKTSQKTTDKAYQTYLDKIRAYCDSVDIKLTARNILKSVAKYGVYVGYERQEGGEFYFQTLPIDYVRIKYKVGNEYQLEFNFKYFDKFFNKEDIDFAWFAYPSEFKKLYNKYKSDKKSKNPEWQMLDIKKTVCIVSEDDDATFIPMFSGMFEALLNNEDYKDLIKLSETLDVTKLIVQKVPTDVKDGNILMTKEAIQYFHNELKKILPEGANGLTTPLDITAIPFSNQSQSKEELLAKAERGAYVASGYSGGLFSDNGGHTGLQMNVEVVTANIFAVLEKIESMFSRKFKNVVNTKNYEFKLKFYRTTNVNIDENFERAFKALGIGGAIEPMISLMGFEPDVYATLLKVEKETGIKDLLQIPESMHTQSGSTPIDNKKSNGNPKKKEKDLTDGGAKSRNVDTGV